MPPIFKLQEEQMRNQRSTNSFKINYGIFLGLRTHFEWLWSFWKYFPYNKKYALFFFLPFCPTWCNPNIYVCICVYIWVRDHVLKWACETFVVGIQFHQILDQWSLLFFFSTIAMIKFVSNVNPWFSS